MYILSSWSFRSYVTMFSRGPRMNHTRTLQHNLHLDTSFEESTKIRANYRRTPESLHHLRPHPTLAYLSRTPTLSESIQPPHSHYTANECVHQQLKLDSHEGRVVTKMHKKRCGMDEYGCNGRTIHTLRVRRLRVLSVPVCARSGLFSQKFCLASNLKLRISVLSLVE
jgi:hypothetical protein